MSLWQVLLEVNVPEIELRKIGPGQVDALESELLVGGRRDDGVDDVTSRQRRFIRRQLQRRQRHFQLRHQMVDAKKFGFFVNA